MRSALGWSQARMGEHIGLSQASVARMEGGGAETGPVSKLLDILAARLAAAAPEDPGVAAPGLSTITQPASLR